MAATKHRPAAAVITIRRAGEMTAKGRRHVAAWLRQQTRFFERHGRVYARRFDHALSRARREKLMPVKLVSVKLDPKEREEKYTETLAADRPIYPWGLTVNLDNETLEKLGIDTLPEVDTELMLAAKVTVNSVSANQSAGGKENRSVGLQITEMCLEKASGKNATAALYGDEGGKS